ncbi:MAG: OPT/YSL family transporter [Candidatus Diapherotrites archaeon]
MGELSLRALLIGAILSVIVAMYSAFAGLKIGGVYWPITTVSVMALGIFTLLKNSNKNEINIAQTAASAGGLLAAGIIFTVPAIWLLGFEVSVIDITLIALIGGVTGIIFSIPLRKEMIENEKLPYADGAAAAAIIEAGDAGGKKAKLMLSMFGVGVLFSAARDYFKLFPSYFNLETLKLDLANLYSWGMSISLIALSGGFLIGPLFTGVWFLGALLSYFLIIPYLVSAGFFATKFVAAAQFTKPLGIGVVIGASLAYFLLRGLPKLKNLFSTWKDSFSKYNKWTGILLIVLVASFTIITEMRIDLSILAIVGAFIMAYIGARVTGEMNVDPMEIFAMIVLIVAKLLFGFNAIFFVFLAAVVCIAAGVAGDMMQDLKTGYILGTKPENQTIAQIVGVVTGALVIGFVMISLQQAYGFGGVDLPAPQAVALAEIVKAPGLSEILLAGILIGALIAVILMFLNLSPIATVAFGIGLYVPIELSFPLFVGGLIRLWADKANFVEKGRLIAAGLIAGEGFTGVVIALLGLAMGFL